MADYRKSTYNTSLGDWVKVNQLEFNEIKIEPISFERIVTFDSDKKFLSSIINDYNKMVAEYDAIVDFKEGMLINRTPAFECVSPLEGIYSIRGTGVIVKKDNK